MAKKKMKDESMTEEPKKETPFDVENALLTVNRFLREGFKSFIEDKKVKTQKEFDKLLQEYGE